MSASYRKRSCLRSSDNKLKDCIKNFGIDSEHECKVVLTRLASQFDPPLKNDALNGKAPVISKNRKTMSKELDELKVNGHKQDACMPKKRRRIGNSNGIEVAATSNVVKGNTRKFKDENKASKVKNEENNSYHSFEIKAEPDASRCDDCLQFYDDPEFEIFNGDSPDAMEELIVLTDKRLSLYTGCESDATRDDYMEKPHHKITSFTVYDKHNHICQFDVGLMERSVDLWFSGFVKPIYSEDPSKTDGVPAKKLGPINEWWTTGFDGGDRALIGFSTAFCDYILMEPSPAYLPFTQSVYEKIYLSKLIIEILSNDMDTTFDDLLETIQSFKPPKGVPSFSQDALFAHAQFIIEQIQSYDFAGDDDEPLLLTTRCIRSLIRMAGATLRKKAAVVTRRKQIDKQVIRKPKKPDTDTKATTTSLVHRIIGMAFGEKIVEEFKKSGLYGNAQRCGSCAGCQKTECGTCAACIHMPKFGGSGNNRLVCLNSVCLDSAVREAEEDESDLEDGSEEEVTKKASVSLTSTKSRRNTRKSLKEGIKWIGKPVHSSGRQVIYKAVSIQDEKLVPGDFVKVEARSPNNTFEVAKIEYLFEDDEGNQMFHAHYFMLGRETLLGDTADKREVFEVDDCEDIPLSFIISGVPVYQKAPPPNWFLLGGIDDPDVDNVKTDDVKSFFYQKWYDPITARFVDPPEIDDEIVEEHGHFFCSSCYQNYVKAQKEMPAFSKKLKVESPDSKREYYSSVSWRGIEFHVGDCTYLDPNSFSFNVTPQPPAKKPPLKAKYDEDVYPELYRKSSDYSRGICNDPNEPFQIGRIISISKKSNCSKVSAENVRLRVGIFYRPENTHLGVESSFYEDMNLLFWSSEEASVTLENVAGKCHISFCEETQNCFNDFRLTGVCQFYFTKAYDSKKKSFSDPPAKITSFFPLKKDLMELLTKSPQRKLRTLDVFAGCGGLSEGFHQVGIVETKWAIEFDEAAAEAFRRNNPSCTVFHENCNKLLKQVMEGQQANNLGQRFPKKGDIDMIVGGPPCQGFSGMNRFNYRQYAAFKNSLIATYLSYCDYYRPKFFILENVRNFVAFKKNMVLKLTMSCLIRMGYQCTFGILQAGNYGVPQSRRRAIIIAAAPGEKLPTYPEPTNVFSSRGGQLATMVDDKKFVSNIRWTHSAPYRMVTVRDTMSDLPLIANGERKEEMSYTGPPRSSFQKMVRAQVKKEVLRDHICKEMHALVEARFKHIPCVPGSDWRDLPNIVIQLPGGQYTKKLKYNYHDTKNGNSSKGAKRGVCACAEGKSCDPMDRQLNTLIPWCLPHTSNRHAQWAGLYGRLNMDGYFCTTVTNPEPMGKQGLIVHPEENRVVSVRECARSQGFPDSYIFHGTILDRHKQIGNAVPPPLAAAIALEFKKSIAED